MKNLLLFESLFDLLCFVFISSFSLFGTGRLELQLRYYGVFEQDNVLSLFITGSTYESLDRSEKLLTGT